MTSSSCKYADPVVHPEFAAGQLPLTIAAAGVKSRVNATPSDMAIRDGIGDKTG